MDQLTTAEATALADGGAVLLDVREPWEWATGHAPTAVPMPMSTLAGRLEELSTNVVYVCVCRSGARSMQVARALESRGFTAQNLARGMQGWAQDGAPVVTDAGDPGTVA